MRVRQFLGNLSGVVSVAFSPDGRVLATAADDGTVILWDITDTPPNSPSPSTGQRARAGGWDARVHAPSALCRDSGLLVPVVGLFYKDLTNRYMTVEAQGMKRAAESA